MFRNATLRRFAAISAACSSLVLGLPWDGAPIGVAWAQPAPAKPSASIAPKPAPSAPTTTSETPATPPVPEQSAPPPAQEPPTPPVVAAPAPTPAPEILAQWQAIYERGKAALASGAFPVASQMLNDVAMRAPDPALRDKARELGQLASYWTYNRFVLKPGGNILPPLGKTPMLLEDKRSIDELAILYANTLVWGTGFGVVVGFLVDNPDASTFFLPAIGMSALGAGALALMDVKYGPLPYGVPQSITSGMYMGLEVGIYVTGILDSQNVVRIGDKVFPGLMWGSATAGGLIGGLVAATNPVTPGRASFTSSGAIWGGLLTSLVTIGALDGDFQTAPFVTGLIGATAGGITTGILGASFAPSIARVRFIDVGAFAGGLVFGGLYASVADRMDGQALMFLTSAGIATGLATSAVLTRNMDRDEPRRGNPRKSAQWRSTPFMSPRPGGGTLGLAGTF